MKIFTYDTLMIPVMKVSNLDGLLLFPTQITHVERKIRQIWPSNLCIQTSARFWENTCIYTLQNCSTNVNLFQFCNL